MLYHFASKVLNEELQDAMAWMYFHTKKDGGEMLIAIVLDKPLSEAQALLDDPDAFMLEITKIIQNKHAHPVILSPQNVSLPHQKAKAVTL